MRCGGDSKSLLRIPRVFEAVHDEIQFAVLEADFEFLRPEGFVVEFVQGGGLVVVARCLHGVDFVVVVVRPCFFQCADDFVGLHAREEGLSGADVEGFFW